MSEKIVIDWNGQGEQPPDTLAEALRSLLTRVRAGGRAFDVAAHGQSFIVAYVCKKCGRVLPYTLPCSHAGPSLTDYAKGASV